MNRKIIYTTLCTILLSSCSSGSFYKGTGQVIFHWERENTGIEKFSRDHSECMKRAEGYSLLPNIKSWFYSEEAKLDIRANWHQEKGVWASYVPYPGAQPLVINSLHRNEDINPKKYRLCMEDKGYWHRTYNLPTTTNIYVYTPQKKSKGLLFSED